MVTSLNSTADIVTNVLRVSVPLGSELQDHSTQDPFVFCIADSVSVTLKGVGRGPACTLQLHNDHDIK